MRNLFDDTSDDFRVKSKKDEYANKEVDPNENKPLAVCTVRHKNFLRRISAEEQIADAIPWHPEKGVAYHCFSYCNVDLMGYVRFILKQQKLKYMVLTCMVIAPTDVDLLAEWVNKGYIQRLDVGVQTLLMRKYPDLYNSLCETVSRGGGRVAVFNNHSKIIVGFGDRYDFVLESSGNPNTNPRCEQTCLTIDSDLAKFFKKTMDEIVSFNDDFKDWKPYNLD